MNTTAIKIISLAALVVAIGPSLLFFGNVIGLNLMKSIMLGGSIAWFAAAPFWLGREVKSESAV